MKRLELTAERLRELLSYDHETGVFIWRIRSAQRMHIGDIAGCRHIEGYRHIRVDRSRYLSHRLAWLYVYGAWPLHEIDHIDGNKSNNAIGNLRDVPRLINMQNRRKMMLPNRSSDLIGVSAHGSRWAAAITTDGTRLYLGHFDSQDQAHAAYVAAKRQLHQGNTL